MVGLSANSGFGGVTEQNFFKASPKVRIMLLVTKMEAGFICKQVHGLFFDGYLELSNILFTGSFLFRKCHMLTIVQDCRFEAQMIADLRSVLVTFVDKKWHKLPRSCLLPDAILNRIFPLCILNTDFLAF